MPSQLSLVFLYKQKANGLFIARSYIHADKKRGNRVLVISALTWFGRFRVTILFLLGQLQTGLDLYLDFKLGQVSQVTITIQKILVTCLYSSRHSKANKFASLGSGSI